MKLILTEQQVINLAKKISESDASDITNPLAGAEEKFQELAPNLSKLAKFLKFNSDANTPEDVPVENVPTKNVPIKDVPPSNDVKTNQQILSKLGKNEMMNPLGKKHPIDSGFGVRRAPYDPISRRQGTSDHKGVDIGIASGSPVYAPLNGTVIAAYDTTIKNNRCGGLIKIDHGDLITKYCHLSKFNVKEGDKVEKGQIIAYTGGGKTDPMRGTATGPHLHYEIIDKKTGLAQNPVDIQRNLV